VPYRVVAVGGGKYKVVNALTGKVHAKRTTKRKALAQVRIMNAAE